MGWNIDKLHYTYTVGTLKAIAFCYTDIYLIGFHRTMNPYGIAEYKADFDMALDSIGKGHWQDLYSIFFRSYRYYGKAQQVVIADVLGITDWELQAYGFYQIPQLRGKAYKWMADFLNNSYGRGDVQS